MPGTTVTARETSAAALARFAGVAYLVIIFTGVTADLILRAPLAGAADVAATLLAMPDAFRLSLLFDALMIAADVTLALLFYVLLRAYGRDLALAVLVLRLMQAALIAASLVLLTTLPGLAAAGEGELARVFLELHATGYDVGLLFFGMNSLLMWRLLARSAVPGWIAVAIGLSGVVYLAGSTLRLVAPELLVTFEPAYVVPLVAETSLCLWLLIRAKV